MADLPRILHQMPLSSLIVVSLLMVMGLLLWIAGRRILRGAFGMLGFLVGGAGGWYLGTTLNLGAVSWITALVGAVVLALILAMATRFAIAGAMAAIFSIAAPLGVISFAEWQARSEGKSLAELEARNPITNEITGFIQKYENPETREQLTEAVKAAADRTQEQIDRAKAALTTTLNGKAQAEMAELQQFSQQLIDVIRQKWDNTPQSLRPTLSVSMLAGALFGLLLGGVAPTLSGAVITSLGGSLLWLCGLQILAMRFGATERIWLPQTSTGWMALWLITSLVGTVIQWTFRRRSADMAA